MAQPAAAGMASASAAPQAEPATSTPSTPAQNEAKTQTHPPVSVPSSNYQQKPSNVAATATQPSVSSTAASAASTDAKTSGKPADSVTKSGEDASLMDRALQAHEEARRLQFALAQQQVQQYQAMTKQLEAQSGIAMTPSSTIGSSNSNTTTSSVAGLAKTSEDLQKLRQEQLARLQQNVQRQAAMAAQAVQKRSNDEWMRNKLLLEQEHLRLLRLHEQQLKQTGTNKGNIVTTATATSIADSLLAQQQQVIRQQQMLRDMLQKQQKQQQAQLQLQIQLQKGDTAANPTTTQAVTTAKPYVTAAPTFYSVKKRKLKTTFDMELEALARVCIRVANARTDCEMRQALDKMTSWLHRCNELMLLQIAQRDYRDSMAHRRPMLIQQDRWPLDLQVKSEFITQKIVQMLGSFLIREKNKAPQQEAAAKAAAAASTAVATAAAATTTGASAGAATANAAGTAPTASSTTAPATGTANTSSRTTTEATSATPATAKTIAPTSIPTTATNTSAATASASAQASTSTTPAAATPTSAASCTTAAASSTPATNATQKQLVVTSTATTAPTESAAPPGSTTILAPAVRVPVKRDMAAIEREYAELKSQLQAKQVEINQKAKAKRDAAKLEAAKSAGAVNNSATTAAMLAASYKRPLQVEIPDSVKKPRTDSYGMPSTTITTGYRPSTTSVPPISPRVAQQFYDLDLSTRTSAETDDKMYLPTKIVSKIMYRALPGDHEEEAATNGTTIKREEQARGRTSSPAVSPTHSVQDHESSQDSISISDDAVTFMQECATEFLLYFTSEARDLSIMQNRRTKKGVGLSISGSNVVEGMENLGFTSYARVLSGYNEKVKASQDAAARKKLERKKLVQKQAMQKAAAVAAASMAANAAKAAAEGKSAISPHSYGNIAIKPAVPSPLARPGVNVARPIAASTVTRVSPTASAFSAKPVVVTTVPTAKTPVKPAVVSASVTPKAPVPAASAAPTTK